jgi:hypothetical protein
MSGGNQNEHEVDDDAWTKVASGDLGDVIYWEADFEAEVLMPFPQRWQNDRNPERGWPSAIEEARLALWRRVPPLDCARTGRAADISPEGLKGSRIADLTFPE